ncbi:MAG: hypothetical protein ACOYJV_09600 [Aminivibrio sp.]
MKFTERSHAFIPARFYGRLTEEFGERGLRAFIHGTRYYGEQRGRRMAQRAIRDGRELDFEAYLEYSEWYFQRHGGGVLQPRYDHEDNPVRLARPVQGFGDDGGGRRILPPS